MDKSKIAILEAFLTESEHDLLEKIINEVRLSFIEKTVFDAKSNRVNLKNEDINIIAKQILHDQAFFEAEIECFWYPELDFENGFVLIRPHTRKLRGTIREMRSAGSGDSEIDHKIIHIDLAENRIISITRDEADPGGRFGPHSTELFFERNNEGRIVCESAKVYYS